MELRELSAELLDLLLLPAFRIVKSDGCPSPWEWLQRGSIGIVSRVSFERALARERWNSGLGSGGWLGRWRGRQR
jgi:hypothetical protein